MEGRGDSIDATCAVCGEEQAIYRCQSCASGRLLCENCIVETHGLNPLHVVEVRRYLFDVSSVKSICHNRLGPTAHILVGCPSNSWV